MSGTSALLGLLGAGFSTGLLLLIRAARSKPGSRPALIRKWLRLGVPAGHTPRSAPWWLAAALIVGLIAGAATGWVVGGLLATLATWSVPLLLPARQHDRAATAKIESIAAWAEMLRDTLAAAAGLEQTIMATAHTAPEPIRPHIQGLAVRLAEGERLPRALRHLQDSLADPTADLILTALRLASEHQARHLGPLLGDLAATARDQAQMRQRIEASRARTRTTVRLVMATTAAFTAGLVLVNRAFLAPYDSASGQIALLLIGALFVGSFVWMRRMSRLHGPERFLSAPDAAADGAGDTQGAHS